MGRANGNRDGGTAGRGGGNVRGDGSDDPLPVEMASEPAVAISVEDKLCARLRDATIGGGGGTHGGGGAGPAEQSTSVPSTELYRLQEEWVAGHVERPVNTLECPTCPLAVLEQRH
jgi:hypothetical protein